MNIIAETADVIREVAADRRCRGFPGRPTADRLAEDDSRRDEEAGRDRDRSTVGSSPEAPS